MNSKIHFTQEKKRQCLIAMAGWIALGGNLILALAKMIIGILYDSLAVLGDGIDSATDVAIACMALIISKIITLPSDGNHPWGHGRAETVATMIISFIIFYAGVQLFISSGKQLINILFIDKNIRGSINNITIHITILSIIGKLLLAWNQYYLGKKANSSIILANAQNMALDTVISISVLIGLAMAKIFNLRLLDPAIAFIVGIWVIKNAIKLFFQMNLELMDGSQDKKLYQKLFHAVNSIQGVINPHRVRIRRISSLLDIDLDIEVSPSMTVYEAHSIAEKVVKKIKEEIPNIYDIMVHIEPAGHGDHFPNEQYGLTEEEVDTI